MTTYRHTPEMGEISGFGGGYEECCQDMLEAGVKWLDEHKNPDLQIRRYENVYGILFADSDDAKELEKVIIEAAKGDASGAMHQCIMERLYYISKNGWDRYCQELIEHEKTECNQEDDGDSPGSP